MGHGHHHHHQSHAISRKLTIATAANVVIVVAELAIGVLAGSLALIGDALHNLTDAVALILALFAVRLERRKPNTVKTYGYQRAGVLTAFINAGMLVAFTAYIFIEAFDRLRNPQPVETGLMMVMAAIALFVNGATALSLHHDGKHDVNIRSAVIHMIGDAVSSAGIIVAAVLIRWTGSAKWDPAISVLIAVMILWSSWGILRETVNLLLEGTPAGIDPEKVTGSLAALDGVSGVHHLHIWALGPSSPALSCHVMVGDVPLKNTSKLLDTINALLVQEYGIVHATVQFEFANCAADDPYCVPWARSEPPQVERRK